MTGSTTNSEYIAKSQQLSQRTGEPQAFGLIRSFGQKYLETNAWPSRKHEDWRYTSAAKFSAEIFAPSLTVKPIEESEKQNIQQNLKWPSQHEIVNIVFINGIFHPEFSEPAQNLRILNLKQAIEKGLYPIFDLSKPQNNFEALNLSLLEHGVYLDIPDHTLCENIIQISFINTGNNFNKGSNLSTDLSQVYLPRVVVKAGLNSRANVYEKYESLLPNAQPLAADWTNAQIEVHLENKAELHWARLQNQDSNHLHTCRSQYHLKDESKLHLLLLSQGAAVHRHDLNITLFGEKASAIAHGISLGTAQDHRDHHTLIDFKKGHSTAEQIFKSILNGESKSIFNGKIIIQQNSQKVESSQLNQSLLLSEKAEANSQPQLEIYADDVKATHGATVGQLNSEELFYFKSRGISERKAKLMMTEGFALDLIERFPNEEIKFLLRQKIKNKLQGFW